MSDATLRECIIGLFKWFELFEGPAIDLDEWCELAESTKTVLRQMSAQLDLLEASHRALTAARDENSTMLQEYKARLLKLETMRTNLLKWASNIPQDEMSGAVYEAYLSIIHEVE